MNLPQAYDILKAHQHYRKCHKPDCECEASKPKELSEAIEFILKYVDQDLVNDL